MTTATTTLEVHPQFAVDITRRDRAYSTSRQSGFVQRRRINDRARRRWLMRWETGTVGDRDLLLSQYAECQGEVIPFYFWAPSRDRNVLTDSYRIDDNYEWTFGCDNTISVPTLASTEATTILNPLQEYGGVYKLTETVDATLHGCARKDFVGLHNFGPPNSFFDTAWIKDQQTISCFWKAGTAKYIGTYLAKRAGGSPPAYGPIYDFSTTPPTFVSFTNSASVPGFTYGIDDWGGGWYRVKALINGVTTTGGAHPTIGAVRQIFLVPHEAPETLTAGLFSYIWCPQVEDGSRTTGPQPTKGQATRFRVRFTRPVQVTQVNAVQFRIEAEVEEAL